MLSRLEAKDCYDLILLTVRENQLHAALEDVLDEPAHNTREYLLDAANHPNWFDASYISWLSYDSLNVELPDGYLYFAPIVNWGKYREENGRLMMPVSVRLNHAIADGYLLACFDKGVTDDVVHQGGHRDVAGGGRRVGGQQAPALLLIAGHNVLFERFAVFRAVADFQISHFSFLLDADKDYSLFMVNSIVLSEFYLNILYCKSFPRGENICFAIPCFRNHIPCNAGTEMLYFFI